MIIRDAVETSVTTLQKGDLCTWIVRDGTVVFQRVMVRLRHSGGGDKFLVYPANRAQFYAIVRMIAEVTGNKVKLIRDDAKLITFEFI